MDVQGPEWQSDPSEAHSSRPRRGANTAHPAPLRCAREPTSRRVVPTGAERDAQPRLRARVRTASWEAGAQLMLAMETRAVLEAPGQLLVPAASIVGRELPTDLPRGDVVPGRPRVAPPLG
ncbi:hypothetical protein NN561_000212 [Cricetulus griseus]